MSAWDQARREVGDEQAVMLTDASNVELDSINQLAQQARDRAGELGTHRVPLRDRPYQLAAGDRIIFTASHPQPGQQRVENGTTGTITSVENQRRLAIQTTGPNPRQVHVDTREFQHLKLAYAQHVYKAQGLTCQRAFVLTGGWQTDREHAYVALTRARQRTDIHLARTDIGEDTLDHNAIDRLADTIARSNAQQASLSREPRPAARPQREPQPLSRAGRILRERQAREQAAQRSHGPGLGF
ncbi:MAG: hypothetical protein ACYCUM_07490 [Solirubrobacteraceae bacterium]